MGLQAFFDFFPGFVDVAVDGKVELLGQCQDAFETAVGDGVGRVWCQAEADQWVVAPVFAGGQSFIQVVPGIAGVWCRKLEGGDADHGAHAELGCG